MKAIWHDTIVAESRNTVKINDDQFFPPDSINSEFFQLSDTHTTAPGKGRASYFHIQVGENKKADAAWFYPHPEKELEPVRNYVTFGKDIELKE